MLALFCTKDTDNPPDVDSSTQPISVLRKLTDSLSDHRRKVALADHSHCGCANNRYITASVMPRSHDEANMKPT